jgi:hypothetical protein
MRDPLGYIKIAKSEIKRFLYAPLNDGNLLKHAVATELVNDELLIPFDIVNPSTVTSPRVPFVSYPHEWCDSQVLDAAKLTLKISERILDDGYELKDTSAWNVIYHGCKPKFCDHTSFQKINSSKWWAFAQFIRHFILTLCLSKYRQFNAYKSFQLNRDGISPQEARNIIGLKRYLTRYWIITPKANNKLQLTLPQASIKAPKKSNHRNLYFFLDMLLKGLDQKVKNKSAWNQYQLERKHYDDNGIQFKLNIIDRWIKKLRPEWVTDLGCNTGEFSKIAEKNNSKVIAIDQDHNCIQDLYLSSKNLSIYPVIANLDDLIGSRGWANKEFLSLSDRLKNHSDMLMMLALIHHLTISNSIPFIEIAKFASTLTKRYLILEIIDDKDPLVLYLSKQRNRNVEDFKIEYQTKAFDLYFKTIEALDIPGTNRKLLLMEKIK